jgi:hypothetical protein
MDMRKALIRRAQLLGEGLSGGASIGSDYSLSGGMRKPRKARKAKGITGGRMAMGITGGKRKAPKKAPKRASRKGVVPKQLKAWMNVVKQVRALHPDKPYKMVLQLASSIYKKM